MFSKTEITDNKESNSIPKISESEIFKRLELSRKESAKGNYLEADLVLKEIREKYDL